MIYELSALFNNKSVNVEHKVEVSKRFFFQLLIGTSRSRFSVSWTRVRHVSFPSLNQEECILWVNVYKLFSPKVVFTTLNRTFFSFFVKMINLLLGLCVILSVTTYSLALRCVSCDQFLNCTKFVEKECKTSDGKDGECFTLKYDSKLYWIKFYFPFFKCLYFRRHIKRLQYR